MSVTGSAEASDTQPIAERRARRRHALRQRIELREGESVKPLELFFDLVRWPVGQFDDCAC